MKGDFVLILGIFLVVFVLWVYTGGPTRPISFAGPYLTPLTTPSDESEGYDDGTFLGMPGWRDGNSGGGTSGTYGGSVSLGGGNASATDEDEEYLTLSNNSDGPISITGWRLVSERSGVSVTIPSGERTLRTSGRASIVLLPGEDAIITTGDSPARISFAENRCTGYLDASERYYPRLDTSCYSPMDELERYYSGDARSYDRCAEYVESLPSCREARSVPRSVPNACEDFVDDRLSYRGCVNVHAGDEDFFSGTWRVFLGEGRQLWRSSGESIVLIDASGNVVDRYTY